MPAQITEKGRSNASDETAFHKKSMQHRKKRIKICMRSPEKPIKICTKRNIPEKTVLFCGLKKRGLKRKEIEKDSGGLGG